MAIMLYKEGDSVEVKGVKCDFIRCDIADKEHYLKQGYVLSVEDLGKEPESSDDSDDSDGDMSETEAAIRGMSKTELKAMANSMELATYGSAKDLVSRILEALPEGYDEGGESGYDEGGE